MIGGMRGIDAQVKQRMAQNPQRLQQSYKRTGDILDLIALQMIKSERDKKKKDMMLKMQENPETIKQQMERDLFRQTKADLVKQTGGILALQQARQQKNLQKAASGKPRPPMAGIAQPFNRPKPKTPTMANPLAVGLAKAPAPNMQGMTRRAAQGGIVGFEGPEGSFVPEEYTSPDLTDLKNLKEINFKNIIGDDGTDIISKAKTASGDVRSGIESVLKNRDIDKMFDARLKKAQETFGFSDAQKQEYKDLYNLQKQNQARMFDPDRLRRSKISQMLSNAAMTTNLGATGAALMTGSRQADAQADRAGIKAIQDRTDNFRNLLKDIKASEKDVFQAAVDKETLESGEFKQGLIAGVNLTNSDYNLLSDVTKMALDAKIANQDQYTRLAAERIKEQLQLHLNAEDNRVRIQIANLQASTEEKIRKLQIDIEDKRLRDLGKNEMLRAYTQGKIAYQQIMSDNDAAVLGFYKAQLQQLQLEKNAEPEGSAEYKIKEREYNALLKLVQESQALLNEPSVSAIADIDSKIAELSGFSVTDVN
jgi:hypothetical protein